MARPLSHDETIQFLLCCLTHTPGKTDTDAVARDLSLPTRKTAYFRLWSMKKKYETASNPNGSPSTPRKRSRPKKEQSSGDDEDGDAGYAESPSKRRKGAANGTPRKRGGKLGVGGGNGDGEGAKGGKAGMVREMVKEENEGEEGEY